MSGVLQALSRALVETVAATEDGVVRVEGRQRLSASGIVWTADGVIVTASHVVERDEGLRVGLAGGRSVGARLLGRDPATDLAVLRAEAKDLSALPWAEPASLAVGGLVLALGRPGEKVLATLGVLSAIDGGWTTRAGGQIDHYVQSDAVMYPGFSGGPLLDAERRVAGLNSSALRQGLSLAVPLPTVRRVVEAILSGRPARRGYLGVTAQAVPLPATLAQSLGQATGLLLTHVEPRSPADQGRLVQGDTLVTLNGQPLRSLQDLQVVLGSDEPGQRVPLKLVRAGAVREAVVVLDERVSA
jgi:S1-C subfamily serine protease